MTHFRTHVERERADRQRVRRDGRQVPDQRRRQTQELRARGERRRAPEEQQKVAEQNDPLGGDPLVMDALGAIDDELAGPDPCDRMTRSGEPGPCFDADHNTEGEEQKVQPFFQMPDPGAGVEDSLFEGELGIEGGDFGIGVENEIGLFDTEL